MRARPTRLRGERHRVRCVLEGVPAWLALRGTGARLGGGDGGKGLGRCATPIDFIDNTGTVVGLIKGYATQTVDSAKIVNTYHAMGMALGVHSFPEYVRTDANVADLPSRGKWKELIDVLVEALARHQAGAYLFIE